MAIWPAIGLVVVLVIGLAMVASETGEPEEERTAWETVISRAAVAEIGTPSEGVPGDITDRAREPVATAAPPAWALGAEEAAAVVAAAGGAADKPPDCGKKSGEHSHEINICESKSQ